MNTNSTSATFGQNLAELQSNFNLSGISKFRINFKKNKVTASCLHNGFNYGSRGNTLVETLNDLFFRVQAGCIG
jgi:hypothetical protein